MIDTEERARAEEVERAVAANISWGLPVAAVLGAIGVGVAFGVGPAILVLASGALVSVIGFLWASLRTLGGDAPLAEGLAAAAAMRGEVSHAAERKRRVLRALKDLELEHSLGKIDDRDYAEISARYREQAKGILREMDVEIEPLRPKAEAIARAYLEKKGVEKKGVEKKASGDQVLQPARSLEEGGDAGGSSPVRVACPSCGASNEPDAAFCKKCRAKLTRVSCPGCATSNEPDATFCKKCGRGLTGGDSPEANAGAEVEAKDA